MCKSTTPKRHKYNDKSQKVFQDTTPQQPEAPYEHQEWEAKKSISDKNTSRGPWSPEYFQTMIKGRQSKELPCSEGTLNEVWSIHFRIHKDMVNRRWVNSLLIHQKDKTLPKLLSLLIWYRSSSWIHKIELFPNKLPK